jgi:lipopolysaccharide biosynthesis protein
MMNIRSIAIYLPQFHPIPENDEAWGKNFTEWTNVKKGVPIFNGHYQPHIPHEDVGYYDLRDPEVLIKQARMAREHGIFGFAFYHYWFNGKRLLETPLDNMIKLGKPDFPFCLIWANENWTKRWDGSETEMIIKQDHSKEDDINHMTFLCEKVFSDSRYIKVDNKPLFLVYRTEIIPDLKQTVKLWKEIAQKYGFKDLYLVRVENVVKNLDPKLMDFDAALEFGPDFGSITDSTLINNYNIVNYESLMENMIAKEHKYKTFNCIFPGWDNSPRRKKLRGSVFINNRPELFKLFLKAQIINSLKRIHIKDEQLLFINAWNEWGEGCHIEPDAEYGYAYLEICKDVLQSGINSGDELLITNYIKQIRKVRELENSAKYSVNFLDYKSGRIIIRFLKSVKASYRKRQALTRLRVTDKNK